MNVAEWILVVLLSVTLLLFLVVTTVLVIKLIHLVNEANKIVQTGQGIAAKADDIVDNVKGMTSVGGIVKTFANRVIENQERRYAEEDAAREAAERAAEDVIDEAEVARREADRAASNARAAARASSRAGANAATAKAKANQAKKATKR